MLASITKTATLIKANGLVSSGQGGDGILAALGGSIKKMSAKFNQSLYFPLLLKSNKGASDYTRGALS